jgi:DNA-binding GntR family transcriptional regulator
VDEETGQAGERSLAARAYEAIRRAILRCELAPGEQVTESQLAGRYGFGRAAVRAALTRLCHEQLVQAMPRHGYEIAPVTFKQVRDLFGLRLIVEPAAARLAAGQMNETLAAELERLNQACAHRTDQDDAVALREANRAFHHAVARASGNERLVGVCAAVLDELERVLYLPRLAHVWDRIDATYAEHERIVEALRRRDPAAAEQAAHDHIVPNMRFVIDVLIDSPQLRSINLVKMDGA